MSLYTKFVKYITFPLVNRYDGIVGISGHLRRLEKQQFYSTESLREIQLKKLQALVRHAYDKVPFYRARFNEHGILPDSIHDFDDFSKLPELRKEDIVENLDSLVSSDHGPDSLIPTSTGGTTGVRMSFWHTRDALAIKQAATFRAERWTGWDFGQRRGLVWPGQLDYVGETTWKAKIKNAIAMRNVTLPAATLNESVIEPYIRLLKAKRVTIIRGFTNCLYALAKHINTCRDSLPYSTNIIATGEPLYKHQRTEIQRAFGGDVFDSYGAREVSLVAQECEHHQGLHLNMECNYVEAVLDGGKAACGETGALLVTDLVSFGMPLIRYRIGDMGVLLDTSCSCGRGLSLMGRPEGRLLDVLKRTDGTVINGAAVVLYLIDNGPPVGQVQVIQDGLQHLQIKITREPAPDDTVFAHYRATVARLFGEDMKLDFEVVESIEPEQNGKYRFTVCKI
jgi:phenylacetate-CoA ligase